MQRAAEEEDYIKASKLKAKRDASRAALFNALSKAEEAAANDFQSVSKDIGVYHRLDDLSLSTIRRYDDEDDPSVMTMNTLFPIIERPILPREDAVDTTVYDELSKTRDEKRFEEPCVEEGGRHPLEGVPDYLNLPLPEEINKADGGLSASVNSSNSHASTDSIHKIETILGPYCTRCLLSKTWSLREAALLKLSLTLKEVINDLQSTSESASDWWDIFSRGICIILERAMDDRIVQVFLTGLILLDDCMVEFESIEATPKEIISLTSNVVMKLIGKLGDSNPKVVDGSETALMSLALSNVVGPMYIGSQVIKLMTIADSKAIKAVAKRCQFLKALLEEFGTAAPQGKKYMGFIQTYGLGHKDADAREASKELSVALYLRDGNAVLSILDGLPDR